MQWLDTEAVAHIWRVLVVEIRYIWVGCGVLCSRLCGLDIKAGST
jgi:hypothetical protein